PFDMRSINAEMTDELAQSRDRPYHPLLRVLLAIARLLLNERVRLRNLAAYAPFPVDQQRFNGARAQVDAYDVFQLQFLLPLAELHGLIPAANIDLSSL